MCPKCEMENSMSTDTQCWYCGQNLVPEPARQDKAVFASTELVGCAVCGGKTVSIRGRRPGAGRREVCPTCIAETLDDLRAVISGDNRPAQEASQSRNVIVTPGAALS
jgi:hypothetical protein